MRLPPKNTPIKNNEVINLCEKIGGMEREIKAIYDNPPKKSFIFDGASGCPENISKLIDEAAFPHDVRYWLGGSEDDRMVADLKLGVDVIRRCGRSHTEAKIVFDFVRIGGVSWLPTPWRWGFGR